MTDFIKNGSYSSTLTIEKTGLLGGINFFNGTTTAADNDVTFTLPKVALDLTDEFPVEGNYKYLEMNYLLVDLAATDATLLNATYNIQADGTEVNNFNLSALPVRANYQTNVYGSLLTTKNQFSVKINEAFNGTAGTWDNGVKLNVVNTAEELINNLNDGKSIFVAKNANIDFSSLPASTNTKFSEPVTMVVEGTISNIQTSLYFDKGLTLSGNGTIEFDLSTNNHTINVGHYSETPSGDLTMENVTITGKNAPSQATSDYPYIAPLLEIRGAGSVNMKNVTVENFGGDAVIVESKEPAVFTNCKFISHNTLTKLSGENDIPAVAMSPWGNTEFTFNNCEFVGPIGFSAAMGNSGSLKTSYTFTFNDCIIICNESDTNIETGPFGIIGMFGNGDVYFNNSYLYSENNYLCYMWAFGKDRVLAFKDCYVNVGARNLELSEDGNSLIPLPGNDYTYTPVSPEIVKIVNGVTYKFGEILNGSKVFKP